MTIIAALSQESVIGLNGKMPWHIPEEYEHFLTTIAAKTVIIGRKSFAIFGPTLTSAHTVVVTRSSESFAKAMPARSIAEAVTIAASLGQEVYVAGGADIYQQMVPLADRMLLSFVKGDYAGDAYFPLIGPEWKIVFQEDRGAYTLVEYRRECLTPLISSGIL
jgi:dihydrofolate reductase